MMVCVETRRLIVVVRHVVYVVGACVDAPLSQPIVFA